MHEEHQCRGMGWLASQEKRGRAKSQIPIQGFNHSLFCVFYFLLTKKTVFPQILIPSDAVGFVAQSWNIPGVGRADEAPVSHEQTLPYCATCMARVMFSPPMLPLLIKATQNTLCLFIRFQFWGFVFFFHFLHLLFGAVKPGLTREMSHHFDAILQEHS